MRSILAITMGDAAGVGAEIAVKALRNRNVYEKCIPVVVGDYEPMADAAAFTKSGLTLNKSDDPSQARGCLLYTSRCV